VLLIDEIFSSPISLLSVRLVRLFGRVGTFRPAGPKPEPVPFKIRKEATLTYRCVTLFLQLGDGNVCTRYKWSELGREGPGFDQSENYF
jgi:hypothetical protein